MLCRDRILCCVLRVAGESRRLGETRRKAARSEQKRRQLDPSGPMTKSRKVVAADVSRRILLRKKSAPTNVGGYFAHGPALLLAHFRRPGDLEPFLATGPRSAE